jgi:SPX domain protein involved in polyphosphate accumulation
MNKLHFSRYEFKYLIPRRLFSTIESEISLRMEKDRHSKKNGSYFVRSHYFDGSNYCCYQEKMAGLCQRHKFRLRTYNPGTEFIPPVFLELKGRDEAIVYKHRLVIPHDHIAEKLNSGSLAFATYVLSLSNINGAGRKFVFDVFRKRLSPSVVVDYERTAFENRSNPDFRATIDSNIIAFRADRNGKPIGPGFEICAAHSILELKFRYHLPKWMHGIIQFHNLRRISFSKFSQGTDKACLGLLSGGYHRYFERRIACP